jgi:hypothetical protein
MVRYNRSLEKSIGQYDETHAFKLGLVYELPIGVGKRDLSSGDRRPDPRQLACAQHQPVFAQRPGGARHHGQPAPLRRSQATLRHFLRRLATPTASGSFDPSVDTFFVPYGTGTPYAGIGNATRYNPKVRHVPNLNENLSVAKTFVIHEQFRLDFRAEAFNAFNRVRFSTGSTQLQTQTFGRLTSNSDLLNTPRQLQFALKLHF